MCEFDELNHDVLHNRILKATLRDLLRTDGLDPELRGPLRATWHRLHDVSDIRVTDRTFGRVQLHRHVRSYRLLLDVCRLLNACLIPVEGTGRLLFRSFLKDEKRMRTLFERFVCNFYRRHALDYRADPEVFRWEDVTGSPEHLRLLPAMRTDVTLRGCGRVFVVDAKYYHQTLQHYRGRPKVRSGHLYQLFAYLRNTAKRAEKDTPVEGMLLYPLTAVPLDLTYHLHGHRIRIYTLDLSRPWQQIHNYLIGLLPG